MVPAVLRYKNLPITRTRPATRINSSARRCRSSSAMTDMSALVLVMLLAFRTRNNTGFVAGGSWDFAMAIADRYRTPGRHVAAEHPRDFGDRWSRTAPPGVQCADGAFVPAATVVSCADGHTTIFKMLEGKFVDQKIRFFYEHCQTFPAILQVSLGIKQVFPERRTRSICPCASRSSVDDQTRHDRLEVETFGAESGLCPEGTTLMTVRLPTRYEFWTGLKKNDVARYRAEKRRVVREVVAALEPRFPGLTPQIEGSDIATPATFFRYTGNWQGSYEGWLPTPRILGRRIPYTLPRLKNFYMAGHWVVAGGGLPSAALAGRYVAQMICVEKGKVFAATEP